MIKAMGGAPTPMAFGEVYTALQSGVIDGAENNEVSYLTQKHSEVAKYFSNTNHLVGLDYVVINTDAYEAMSAEDRAAFDARVGCRSDRAHRAVDDRNREGPQGT